jgi:transcriptional regulator with XRE-family HTH domain
MDWSQIIFDLNKAGFSGAKIAERTGVAPTTINGLKNGHWSEPKHSTGEKLIDLWKRVREVGL